MSGSDDARYGAMVEFLGCFPTLTGPPPTDLTELSDGVGLFEAMSEIAPDHFDPNTIARNLEGNWALKSSNLRKLMRNLETFYHEDLKKTADFDVSISDIARKSDKAQIARVFELVAAAAVTCENRGEFVGRIMSMTPDNQTHMKGVIESSLGRLQDYSDPDDEPEGEGDEGDENEIEFDKEGDDGDDSEHKQNHRLFQHSSSHLGQTSSAGGDMSERDELRAALQDARRELAAHKSQMILMSEENENVQRKLQALSEDLQDRLQRTQDELTSTEGELKVTKHALEDSDALGKELEQKNASLADELDVANSKAAQLRKAEATIVAYRRKLEGVGVMNQQMTDLEDQAATYLRQIVDLESENKKLPALQKNLDDLQAQLSKVEKIKVDSDGILESKVAEISALKTQLLAAEGAKKMFEDELTELRAQQGEGAIDDDIGSGISGLSLTSAQSMKDAKEKTMRLEIENTKLREEVSLLQEKVKTVATKVVAGDSEKSRAEVATLSDELEKKTAELSKVSSEKVRLESYTKKTLAKFQEKYLVALQECKAKLKEKHDKIEALEARSQSEKTAQKREERLLSSTIYEVGITIMQSKLKGSSSTVGNK
mmetsp:Transcript_5479/g.8450  ORF Transcript_5479/g.8450 Transcript_5479/m.8450 type:complete len:602 (+) Transcript_5479:213-2018(+)|eukprot:CAMPEP_0118697610 /NCGR_PEP_ID=MMETSP0800-20121206/14637_1 /TAXON_ID=210618 ORGANISM="Striatella unipunctata, Strain CCMP2910" /NCGR_SAMPLE_ID=MMETSP0800 /ASSEMBLY_ACC=CAM_ASM_000638 /LENGTH=601 /DNA_ID=CAMNT_0006597131 /DNA_START=156 /DNA_END=1961 /DNA_ORIENTATION=+